MFSIFKNKSNIVDPEKANELPTEIKLLIVNGQSLVDSTKADMKKVGSLADLTCKRQLQDDCRRIEDLIAKFYRGKDKDGDVKELEQAIVRLQTTSERILHQ